MFLELDELSTRDRGSADIVEREAKLLANFPQVVRSGLGRFQVSVDNAQQQVGGSDLRIR
jgi:hypothetical protein